MAIPATSWAHYADAFESLAMMQYSAEPVHVDGLEGWVHVFWRGDGGKTCVGLSRNAGCAMLGVAAMDFPTALPQGLCPICHPREDA